MAAKPKAQSSPSFLEQRGPGRSIQVCRDKEIIYSQGSPAEAIFYIQSGIVKLTVESKHRRSKAVLAVLQQGDLFGEGCLGRELRRVSTAISVGPSTITRVEKAVFQRAISRDQAFAAMVIACLLSQISRLKADLADQFLNFSERRLARILLMQSGAPQKSESGHIAPPFSQTALAEMVGTTRSRISHFMTRFREKGLIRYNGGLQVDSERLAAFLQG